ncbi:hypothetical protein ACFVYA_07590 [Amycolatopsis sp. NPDC058278]|uniref:hypothetical protein n=1 Tax=Amycolatopsis sp. NPDC058278 TaxID=3346417 RepID=UPI0036DED876
MVRRAAAFEGEGVPPAAGQPRQQAGDQGDPVGNGIDEHVVVTRVGAGAAAAEPVEHRHAERGEEVRVAAAADRLERTAQFAEHAVDPIG